MDESLFFLRDASLDLVRWRMDNSKREGVRVTHYPELEMEQSERLLPISEINFSRWDRNPWQAVQGDGGTYRERRRVLDAALLDGTLLRLYSRTKLVGGAFNRSQCGSRPRGNLRPPPCRPITCHIMMWRVAFRFAWESPPRDKELLKMKR